MIVMTMFMIFVKGKGKRQKMIPEEMEGWCLKWRQWEDNIQTWSQNSTLRYSENWLFAWCTVCKISSIDIPFFRCTFTSRRKTQKHSWCHATIWILYGTHTRYVYCDQLYCKSEIYLVCVLRTTCEAVAAVWRSFDPAGSHPKPVQINSLLSLSYFSSHRKNIRREFNFSSPPIIWHRLCA